MYIDVGFVTDRDAEDSVIQRWNEHDGYEIFLRNGKEKTRYASDYVSSKSIVAEEDEDNDDGGLQIYYLDVTHVPVVFFDVSVGQDFAKENLWYLLRWSQSSYTSRQEKRRTQILWDLLRSLIKGTCF